MIAVDKPSKRSQNSLLSVVIPVYQEGSHIKSTIRAIERVLIENHLNYELF